jgi:hypothetical protein
LLRYVLNLRPIGRSGLTPSQLRATPSSLSEDFRRICRSKLLGCLADLTPLPTASQKGMR